MCVYVEGCVAFAHVTKGCWMLPRQIKDDVLKYFLQHIKITFNNKYHIRVKRSYFLYFCILNKDLQQMI